MLNLNSSFWPTAPRASGVTRSAELLVFLEGDTHAMYSMRPD